MEIANFKGQVSLRQVVTYNGAIRWLLIYGLQVKTFYDFRVALEAFHRDCRHCAECEGLIDDED